MSDGSGVGSLNGSSSSSSSGGVGVREEHHHQQQHQSAHVAPPRLTLTTPASATARADSDAAAGGGGATAGGAPTTTTTEMDNVAQAAKPTLSLTHPHQHQHQQHSHDNDMLLLEATKAGRRLGQLRRQRTGSVGDAGSLLSVDSAAGTASSSSSHQDVEDEDEDDQDLYGDDDNYDEDFVLQSSLGDGHHEVQGGHEAQGQAQGQGRAAAAALNLSLEDKHAQASGKEEHAGNTHHHKAKHGQDGAATTVASNSTSSAAAAAANPAAAPAPRDSKHLQLPIEREASCFIHLDGAHSAPDIGAHGPGHPHTKWSDHSLAFYATDEAASVAADANARSHPETRPFAHGDVKGKMLAAFYNIRHNVNNFLSSISDSPIWMLGNCYSGKELECNGHTENKHNKRSRHICKFFADFQTLVCFSYRKDFERIPGSKHTTDCGWGCTLRSAQMLVAEALVLQIFGRRWRIEDRSCPAPLSSSKEDQLRLIIRLFQDQLRLDSPFSIHNIVQHGCQLFDKRAGDWFGPASVVRVFADLINQAYAMHQSPFRAYQAIDHIIYRDLVAELCSGPDAVRDLEFSTPTSTSESVSTDETVTPSASTSQSPPVLPPPFIPLLILMPLRLGLNEINRMYIPCLKALLMCAQCVGIIGGRPRHSLYFVGYQEDNVIFADPHGCKRFVDMQQTSFPTETFHSAVPNKIPFTHMDPSMAIGFLCQNQADFDDLCNFLTSLDKKCSFISVENTCPAYSRSTFVPAPPRLTIEELRVKLASAASTSSSSAPGKAPARRRASRPRSDLTADAGLASKHQPREDGPPKESSYDEDNEDGFGEGDDDRYDSDFVMCAAATSIPPQPQRQLSSSSSVSSTKKKPASGGFRKYFSTLRGSTSEPENEQQLQLQQQQHQQQLQGHEVGAAGASVPPQQPRSADPERKSPFSFLSLRHRHQTPTSEFAASSHSSLSDQPASASTSQPNSPPVIMQHHSSADHHHPLSHHHPVITGSLTADSLKALNRAAALQDATHPGSMSAFHSLVTPSTTE
ncbi:hypothetical protein CAOG_03931 [Capsaspora owczarzaki ATCC 30864]|uniref:Peptidase C54 catalytic domain-containing protein n=1 Tax=Capsaspora owczarzaki (strain ATCC 30864) TaxID=595528 RepID=A0A0D2WQC5_CAPO3|nr:hypothetical protein CAOG_03931 [Capsaspora owczarzaki ATCC 30864]KJE93088.1 hypothetical protein CAOG_003931 [Capsaspora owczarzaki ATCC 30864]|eukprot:XP_004363659.2 hypothetical protein CAOG_03931 [Capsaspora owczarzaki ATCC 30864]